MKISMAFLRVCFVLLSLFFLTAFMMTLPMGPLWQRALIGIGVSFLFSSLLFSLEILFKRYTLKAFNTVVLGLFFGYLAGLALNLIFSSVLELSHMKIIIQPQTIDLLKVLFFLIGTYLGTTLTIYFSDQFSISLPFIRLSPSPVRKKDLILDASALSDPRLIDLAATGIVDHTLILPRFILRELLSQSEVGDESVKARAKRCLETFRKLEALPQLNLRFEETPFNAQNDTFSQLIRLARVTESNILTADLSQVHLPVIEGIQMINLHALSNALKPLMQTGESMHIKIQRFGKEANQGIGYLEDGTMVVVNGGGDYIGESIEVQVLSVKHTSSGRMIFCNTMDAAPLKGNHIEV